MATSSAAKMPVATTTEPALKDIHLAESPGFWPPALGWWLLLAVLLMLLGWLFIKVKSKLKQKNLQQQQKKVLLDKLALLENNLEKTPNKAIAEINTLLRQYAVNYYPRAKISSLTGLDWLHFLDKSGNTQGFSKGAGRILLDAPYRATTPQNFNQNEFITLVRKWLSQLVDRERIKSKNGQEHTE